ncbi:MAG: septum formation initiator family protein [Acetobacteraceae bacterium]|nr:septum formation initiator family protein [Acetobacteraceae bacterium]
MSDRLAALGRGVKRRAREALLPVLFSAVCGYFLWHSVHGPRGLLAREQRMQEIAAARAELARAEAERDAMERRVAGLRGEVLDRDQLEERARVLLNLVSRDELVMPYGPGQRLF